MEKFGDVLCVIGNQTSYLISSDKLFSLRFRIWEGQRSLEDKRVKELVAFQETKFKTSGYFCFRGSLLLCRDSASKDIWLIDGQHRYAVINTIVDKEIYPPFNVRVDILDVSSSSEILKEFQDVNRSVPVPLNILQPDQVVNITAMCLRKKFPDAFKDNKTSRPRVNINDFKDVLIKKNVVKDSGVNEHQLYDALCKLNDDFRKVGLTEWIKRLAHGNKKEKEFIEKNIVKCATGDYLYIGLFKTNDWVNDLVSNITADK